MKKNNVKKSGLFSITKYLVIEWTNSLNNRLSKTENKPYWHHACEFLLRQLGLLWTNFLKKVY